MTTLPKPAALRLQDVSAVLGSGARTVKALSQVNLTVELGEFVAVMGPSGSGKSTLLNVAGLLLPPTTGHVFIAGIAAENLNKNKATELRRTHLGFVFQHYNMINTLTLRENVALPLELDGSPTRAALSQAEEALAEVGLDGLGERYPDEVSGGQVQRAAIARALIGPRTVLLADEPTGALDTATSDEVLRVLRKRIDQGAAGLLVTHEPRLAAWADRTVRMRDGQLWEEGA
ncbi:ATP-binding cassette domain-containing protein [Corynebacterium poyangense]|uniref:ATP-binding cassette domain-containing protein n=1 Tax=Corynebacterium poyangense TaxID=2684405 RepID=A0A7H0SMT6_9CORY|nr:ABC transporter ATP-binding protein [Corynebacterium poyangense]QNQ89861.1 ATP-binding cassette domain-containing protein [Corynebacterium poyangense]